jgi:hypothetical protein
VKDVIEATNDLAGYALRRNAYKYPHCSSLCLDIIQISATKRGLSLLVVEAAAMANVVARDLPILFARRAFFLSSFLPFLDNAQWQRRHLKERKVSFLLLTPTYFRSWSRTMQMWEHHSFPRFKQGMPPLQCTCEEDNIRAPTFGFFH